MMSLFLEVIKRNHRTASRAYPWSFIFARILTGCYTSLFSFFTYHYFFQGNLDKRFLRYMGNSDYMTFAVLGACFYMFAVATLMNVGRSLMNELREGTLDTFLISPGSRVGYFLGTFVEQLGRTFLEFAAIVVIGMILGAHFSYIPFGSLILIFLLAFLGFFGMGVTLATVMLYLRDTYISQNTLFAVMNFLCGVSFPIFYLPTWLQPLSHLFPLTSALQLFRAVIINGQSLSANIGSVIELAVLGVVYLVFGFLWLAKVEKRLIEVTFG
jgi:ABC-2 type transport system permease protein